MFFIIVSPIKTAKIHLFNQSVNLLGTNWRRKDKKRAIFINFNTTLNISIMIRFSLSINLTIASAADVSGYFMQCFMIPVDGGLGSGFVG